MASLTRFSKNITFFTFPVRDISPINTVFLDSGFESLDDIILAAIAKSSPGSENDKPLENTINSTVEEIAPSVVSIIIKKDMVIYRSDPWGFFQQPAWTVNRKVGWGSGFFVKKDGTIITNKHVVQDIDAQYTVILNTWEEYDAKVIALDPVNDLAVIKITDTNRDFTALPLIESLDEVKVWDFWIAVWNALAEFQNSVSLWIVSGKNRTIEAGWDSLSWLLQTDAAISLKTDELWDHL